MDFDRAIIKCLFYSVQPEWIIDSIKNGCSNKKFSKHLISLLSRELPSFTSREMERLVELELNDINDKDLWSYPFFKIRSVSNDLLDINGNTITIRTNQILRWSETTRFIGEDLMASAKVATSYKDSFSRFNWSTPIGFNEQLRYPATDIHFHISSSYDAFDLKWIVWMNHKTSDIPELASIAVIIRYALYEYLNKGIIDDGIHNNTIFSDSTSEDILNDIYSNANSTITLYINQCVDKIWDYAIDIDSITDADLDCPYILLSGERYLCVNFFRRAKEKGCDGDVRIFYPYLYLYYVIKTYCRKEAILNNGLVGLKNFQNIKHSGLYAIHSVCERYALKTAIENGNGVEARFSYHADKKSEEPEKDFINNVSDRIKYDLNKPFLKFNNPSVCLEGKTKENVSYVLSVSKPCFTSREFLSKAIRDIKKQLDIYFTNFFLKQTDDIPCVGVDFAGSDTSCRPFVFYDIVKYLRDNECDNLTYHVGEDFYDLMDGIRAVDEVLNSLGWHKGNRLGHCLSLFTNVEKYYQTRHFNIIMPKGVLLDNLVWLLKIESELKCIYDKSITTIIEDKARNLYRDIYGEEYPKDAYDVVLLNASNLDDRRYDSDVISKSIQNDTWQMPKSKSIIQLLYIKQIELLGKINARHIHIETCPTSNLLIGFFDKYDETPTAKLYNDNILPSINTDIKGTVCTSLSKEYSLIRLALIKKGYDAKDVDEYLQKVANQSNEARFKNRTNIE